MAGEKAKFHSFNNFHIHETIICSAATAWGPVETATKVILFLWQSIIG